MLYRGCTELGLQCLIEGKDLIEGNPVWQVSDSRMAYFYDGEHEAFSYYEDEEVYIEDAMIRAIEGGLTQCAALGLYTVYLVELSSMDHMEDVSCEGMAKNGAVELSYSADYEIVNVFKFEVPYWILTASALSAADDCYLSYDVKQKFRAVSELFAGSFPCCDAFGKFIQECLNTRDVHKVEISRQLRRVI